MSAEDLVSHDRANRDDRAIRCKHVWTGSGYIDPATAMCIHCTLTPNDVEVRTVAYLRDAIEARDAEIERLRRRLDSAESALRNAGRRRR